MTKYNLKVNGKTLDVTVEPDMPLLWVLRDQLKLKGTKFGCGIAQCGACTVHLNGNAVRSCSLPVSAVGSGEIITIEGLSEDASTPVQKAWTEVNVPQCGYCQAGQIMSASALLQKNPSPSDQEINQAMAGNICRCGSYPRIKEAILLASREGGAR